MGLPRAFLPDLRGEISICRTLGLSENEIWNIGKRIRRDPVLARADFLAATVFRLKLRVGCGAGKGLQTARGNRGLARGEARAEDAGR